MRRSLILFFLCFSAVLFASPSVAENAVENEFSKTAQSDEFYLYYGSEEELIPYAEAILRLTPEVWEDLSRPYPDHETTEPIRIFLTADEELFRESAGLDPEVGFLAAAAPRPERILLLYPPEEWRSQYNLKATLAHELAHILLYRSGEFPRWFHEGYAMSVADQWTENWQSRLYGEVLFHDEVLLKDLNDQLTRKETAVGAYARAFGFLAHLRENYGSEAVFVIVRQVQSGRNFNEAFGSAVGIAPEAENVLFLSGARRRAWISAIGETRTLFIIGAVLLFLAYLGTRIRRREKLAAMERDEKKEDQKMIEDFT